MALPPELHVLRLQQEARLPLRARPEDVGYDIFAFLLSESGRSNTALIPPRTTRAIPTGIAVEAPDGWFPAICSRSGLASKSIWVANAPGIVDRGYRGEIIVLLYNGGHESIYIQHEDRIAQLVLVPAMESTLVEVESLSPSSGRGANGFGSTGR